MKANPDFSSSFSPRLAGAIFFAIYVVLLTLFTKYLFLSLRDSTLFPLVPSLLIALVIGISVGGLLGKALVKPSHWLRPFLLGILLAVVVLILGSCISFMVFSSAITPLFRQLYHWQDYFVVYATILTSFCVTIGVWFIPLTGFIAIYFNKQFFPGLDAVDKQRKQGKNHRKIDINKDE